MIWKRQQDECLGGGDFVRYFHKHMKHCCRCRCNYLQQEHASARTLEQASSTASTKTRDMSKNTMTAAAVNLQAKCPPQDLSTLLPEPPFGCIADIHGLTKMVAPPCAKRSHLDALPRPSPRTASSLRVFDKAEACSLSSSETGSRKKWDQPSSPVREEADICGDSLPKQRMRSTLDEVADGPFEACELDQQQLLHERDLDEQDRKSFRFSGGESDDENVDRRDITRRKSTTPQDTSSEGTNEDHTTTGEAHGREPISLTTVGKTLKALTLSIESMVYREAGEDLETGSHHEAPSSSSTILDSYTSAAGVGTLQGSVQAALTKAVVAASDEHRASSDVDPLESFELGTRCRAILDLITQHAHEILPEELLSGLVTVGKVHAQHHKKGPPGRVELFDALFSHIRSLTASRETNPAAVAAIFAPCFFESFRKKTQQAHVDGGRGDRADCAIERRYRRKILALLEEAADPDGPEPNRTPTIRGASISVTGWSSNNVPTGGDLHGEELDKRNKNCRTRGDDGNRSSDDGALQTSKRRNSSSDSLNAPRVRQVQQTTSAILEEERSFQQQCPQKASPPASTAEVDTMVSSAERRESGRTSKSSTPGVLLGWSSRKARKKKECLDLSAVTGIRTGCSGDGGQDLPEFMVCATTYLGGKLKKYFKF